jgi:Gpi18-like mannosyltransferase
MSTSHNRQPQQFMRATAAPLAILLGSRAVVGLAIVFSSKFVGRSAGDYPEFSDRWYRYLLRWDAGWYFKIASEGYSYDGNDFVQHPVIFYPLYPLLAKVIIFITRISPGAALLLVANTCLIAAVLLFFKFTRDKFGETAALYGTATLCFFPASFFLSAAYTESLALFLILVFFLFLERGSYMVAALFAALTIATRSTGIILALVILVELWRRYSGNVRRLLAVAVPAILIATSGLWIYMLYLHLRFHNALAFMTNIRAWREGTAVRSEIFQALTLQPFRHLADVWKIGPDPNTLSVWFFLAFVVIVIVAWNKLSAATSVYCAGVLLLPYLTLSGSVGFPSFTRYSMLAFPVFALAGSKFAHRPWMGLTVIGLFAALLFMYMLFFAQWYFAG